MFDRIKALLHRWQELKEISALSDRDLDDLGMTRDQVERFVRMPHDVADRVTHMGAIFGLDPETLHRDHAAWVELLETCGGCSDRGACRMVQSRGELAGPADCGFCPNHGTFDRMAQEGAARAA